MPTRLKSDALVRPADRGAGCTPHRRRCFCHPGHYLMTVAVRGTAAFVFITALE
jgi:hypothetical protein